MTHSMLPVRIASKLQVDSTSGCWNWTAYRKPTGYGMVRDGRTVRHAHRVVYELLRGSVAKSLEVHHCCRNPRCCNPNHLLPVTESEHLAIHATA